MDYISVRDLSIFTGGGSREGSFANAREKKTDGWNEILEVGAGGLWDTEGRLSLDGGVGCPTQGWI